MPRTSASSLVRSQLDAAGRRAARFVDLQLEWVAYGERVEGGAQRIVAIFGGRWDRLAKDYAVGATKARVLEVHAQQIGAIQTFDRWLAEHLAGDHTARRAARVRAAIENDVEVDAELGAAIGLSELFLSGGRRSGKTTIMCGILASYAIAVPGSIVWCVVPSEPFHVEPKEILEHILPADWYSYNGWPHYTFYLANGSQIVIRSGHSAGGLKKGKAAIVGLNEAQQIGEASYRNARGAVVDDGGFTICALNPPTTGDVGTWTADAIQSIAKGDRPGAEHVFIDPLDNPHIDISKLLAMRSGMTEHDWQTQIRGRILAHPDTVLYTWDPVANERPPPDFGKITREFVTAHEGDRAEWNAIVVADVQYYPWIACGIFDAYRDPRAPHDPKAGLLWMRDEVAIARGDEVDVCEELKRRGVDPARTLVILDASCWWQQLQRDTTKQREQFRGKGSADIFKQQGFRHVERPDRAMRSNPDIIERIRATNATIKPADDIRGLFVDPDKCANAAESMRKWRMLRGKPSRNARAAHFGDVVGYACWRFFPRRGSPSKMASEAVPRARAVGYDDLDNDRADPREPSMTKPE